MTTDERALPRDAGRFGDLTPEPPEPPLRAERDDRFAFVSSLELLTDAEIETGAAPLGR